jgi:putative transposase
MKFDPDKHHRRSIRLKGYDYSQDGAYFVTVCTKNRECLFGEIADGEMRLSPCGEVVGVCWQDLPRRYPDVEMDTFVVMPNHVHGIVLVGAQFIAPSQFIAPNSEKGMINHAPILGEIVRTFKAVSSRLVRNAGFTDFVWQRNYYEHIIRDEASLNSIREYISGNPYRWGTDEENPANMTSARAQ